MNKRSNFVFSGFYFFYFAAHCCIISYLNVYLEKYLHFTGTQLGAFSGISILSSVILIPVWGMIGDRTRKYKLLLISFLVSLIIVSFLLSRQTLFAGALFFGILIEISRCGVVPMGDTQAMDYCVKQNGNYGKFRSFGSIGWVISGVILGWLASRYGLDTMLFPIYIILIAGCLLMVLNFPKMSPVSAESSEQKKIQKGSIVRLFRNKNYVFLMIITMATGVIADGITSYIGNHLVFTMAASESYISLNTVFCVIPEIIYVMFFTSRILPKLGFKKAYLLSGFALVIRFAIYSLAPTPGIFLIGSLLHCFTVGCTTAANLAYMRRIVPEEIYGTAVTLMFSAITLGKAIYGYLYGWIYEAFGSRYIFVLMFVIVLLATIAELRTNYLDVEYK